MHGVQLVDALRESSTPPAKVSARLTFPSNFNSSLLLIASNPFPAVPWTLPFFIRDNWKMYYLSTVCSDIGRHERVKSEGGREKTIIDWKSFCNRGFFFSPLGKGLVTSVEAAYCLLLIREWLCSWRLADKRFRRATVEWPSREKYCLYSSQKTLEKNWLNALKEFVLSSQDP